MITKQAEWKEYTGSDEQIAEMENASSGWICKFESCGDIESGIHKGSPYINVHVKSITHYLICNPHPLADMIIRQAQTGQPVWIRTTDWTIDMESCEGEIVPSEDKNRIVFYANKPDWHIPNAEYSFTPFED